MPRRSRKKSITDIYHVMLRGVNRQEIFSDEEDARNFLKILSECKQLSNFELYAYCLMSNHVHLLIKAAGEPLDQIFRRIGSRYVYWYNLKYQRVGHLFQDRYRSETVENEAAFLKTLRYIIQNPMKAGIENTPGTYPWSSYQCYAGTSDSLTDIFPALNMFQTSEELILFLNEKNSDTELDFSDKPAGITDEKAKVIFQNLTGCHSVSEFQALDKKVQKTLAGRLSNTTSLSLGQISRLTGMAKTNVYRASKVDI